MNAVLFIRPSVRPLLERGEQKGGLTVEPCGKGLVDGAPQDDDPDLVLVFVAVDLVHRLPELLPERPREGVDGRSGEGQRQDVRVRAIERGEDMDGRSSTAARRRRGGEHGF